MNINSKLKLSLTALISANTEPQTECEKQKAQAEEIAKNKEGVYVPQCEPNGDFRPLQVHDNVDWSPHGKWLKKIFTPTLSGFLSLNDATLINENRPV